MLTVQQAIERILAEVPVLGVERVSLLEALGRALGQAVYARLDAPPFDNSAVDGYAVHAADTQQASREQPVILREFAYLPAGVQGVAPLPAGHAARVLTGAPIPPGADTMVMIEDTQCNQEGEVLIFRPAQPGDHIRQQGEDVRAGSLLLAQGEAITPGIIAILAAQGIHHPIVYRLPRVGVLTTGDELVPLDQEPRFGQIYNSNLYLLQALVATTPARLNEATYVPDDPQATRQALKRLAESSDLIVSCGGVSVGDRDYVRTAVEELGSLNFWRVKVKPGKPLAFGRIGETLFFGLPGNPVSAFVTYELFVRPALRKMGGFRQLFRPTVPVIAAHDFAPPRGRDEYVRVHLSLENHQLYAHSTGAQGSHIQSSLLGADALLLVPADQGLKADEAAEAVWLQG